MNTITIAIIILAFLGYAVFQGVKSFQLRSMNAALQKKDSETLEKLSKMGMSRKLLGEYVCDLYRLRGYYVAKETEKFEKTLLYMMEKEYKNPEDQKSFLETYFHTFLIRGNRKYADWLLAAIRKTDDASLIHYCEACYAVMLDERSDLIDSLEEDINSKKYYGFALGAILVMVAKQYAYRRDTENALNYYRSAKACFEPRAVYMPVVEKSIRALESGEAQ